MQSAVGVVLFTGTVAGPVPGAGTCHLTVDGRCRCHRALSELTAHSAHRVWCAVAKNAALAALRDWLPGLSHYDDVHNDLAAGATSRMHNRACMIVA